MYYTEDHEWVLIEDGGIALVGITDHAQEQLGDIVFIELPEVGQELEQGAEAAVIESVKAASELKAPVSGTVTEVNTVLDGAPETVNEDATGSGWFCRIALSDPSQLDGLMDEATYLASL